MKDYTLMPGKPFEGTEEETMKTIRAILTEELTAEPKKRPVTDAAKAFMDRTVQSVTPQRRRSDEFPELQDQSDITPSRTRARFSASGHLERLTRPVGPFRPKTRHLALVSLLLIAVLRPHWLVIGVLLSVFFVIGLFLCLGGQRVWGAVLRRVERVERADPARGAQMRTRLDRFACRWDRLLDLLPDGVADSLYMPDFQDLRQDRVAEIDRVVTNRFKRMAEEA